MDNRVWDRRGNCLYEPMLGDVYAGSRPMISVSACVSGGAFRAVMSGLAGSRVILYVFKTGGMH